MAQGRDDLVAGQENQAQRVDDGARPGSGIDESEGDKATVSMGWAE